MPLSKHKRIWVIGDIHGMFDPLLMLIHHIRFVKHLTGEAAKLIFLGDYIDRGPCSKEVVDLILSLRNEFEVVCLAGNHEDMMLQFFKGNDPSGHMGNPWFAGNGGQQTLCSLLNTPAAYRRLYTAKTQHTTINPEDFPLPAKYRDFFENLRYAHTEIIDYDGRLLPFAFTHAPLLDRSNLPIHLAASIPDVTPEEQLSLTSFEEFHAFRNKWEILISHLHLWNRDIPKEKFSDYIVVHGHTPTPALVDMPESVGGFDPGSSLPFVNFADAGTEVWRDGNTLVFNRSPEKIVSMNIDTGAAYGKALTAISLHPVDLFERKSIEVIQARMDRFDRQTEQAITFTFAFRNDD